MSRSDMSGTYRIVKIIWEGERCFILPLWRVVQYHISLVRKEAGEYRLFMKISVPVDRVEEAEFLILQGAGELYGSLLPPFWEKKYGKIPTISRHSHRGEHIPSGEDLRKITKICRVERVPFFLSMEALLVPEGDMEKMLSFVREIMDWGVAGIILSDLNLLGIIRDEEPDVEIHCSSTFFLISGASLRFFRSLGISRAILPGELSLCEMDELTKNKEGFKFDIPVFKGKCPNIEGACSHIHDDPDRRWPCEVPYKKRWKGVLDRKMIERVFACIGEWEGLDHSFSCGICALPFFEKRGFHAARILGVYRELEEKGRAIRMMKRVLEVCRGEDDLSRCIGMGRSVYAEEYDMVCTRRICYFPEFFTDEASA